MNSFSKLLCLCSLTLVTQSSMHASEQQPNNPNNPHPRETLHNAAPSSSIKTCLLYSAAIAGGIVAGVAIFRRVRQEMIENGDLPIIEHEPHQNNNAAHDDNN